MNIVKVVIVDSKDMGKRNIIAAYSKEVDFQIFPRLYVYDPIEGCIENVSYRDGIYEGVMMREVDLKPMVIERAGLKKLM